MREPTSTAGTDPARPRDGVPTDARSVFLERAAIVAAAAWLTHWSNELAREGRDMIGGWPGTLREARVRITGQLAGELRQKGMTALTFEELDRLAKLTYTKAKGDWLAQRVRAPEDGS